MTTSVSRDQADASDIRTFKVGDEVEQLGRRFRYTEAGWKRVNPHTGGVSEMTPFERRFFRSARELAAAQDARTKAAQRILDEHGLRTASTDA